jgi:tight adherence protein B
VNLDLLGQQTVLVSILSALAVFTIIFGLNREWQRRRNRVAERLRQLELQRQGLLRDAVPARDAGQIVAALNRFAGRVGLDEQLSRAGVPLTAGEFILLVAIVLGVGLILSVVLHNVFLLLILAAAAVWAPRWWIASRHVKRARDFNNQLPAMIHLLANAIRSGNNTAQALDLAARQSKPPMSRELQLVVQKIAYGTGVKEALESLTARIQSVDLQLLVTAITIQMETGGNLVQILERISETIRERVRLEGEIKALTAQQRYSGYVVALLPVAISLLLFLFNPNYILNVFRTTVWCGWVMFLTAGVMIVIGVVVIRKVVDIRV